MMMHDRPESRRLTLTLATAGTAVLVFLGYIVSQGKADTLAIGAAAVLLAVIVALVSPAAGIAAVLLAAPTMYDLYPMPRGEFSLLELAILTSTLGIAARMVVDGLRTGFNDLWDIIRPAHVVVPVALLLGAAALSLVTLADPAHRAESLREVRTVIIEPLLFLASARMAMRRDDVRTFSGVMLLVAGSAVSIFAVAQIAFDLGGVEAGDLTRATATYTHPNNLALYLERILLVSIGVGMIRPRWWPVWLVAGLQFAGLMLTYSRGALIAIVAGVALLLLLRGLYAWLLLLVAGGIGVAGLGLILFPDRLIDAGGSGAEPTRFTIWRASLRMALDHPVFGVGPDQFLYHYSRRYIEPMGWPERYTSHPHNLVLDVWLRLGVLGLAAMMSLAVGLLGWVKRWFSRIREDAWSMGALAALAGGLAHGMVDNGFFLPDLATLTWFFVALVITVPLGATRKEPVVEEDVRPVMERTWPGQTGATEGTPSPERMLTQAVRMNLVIAGVAGLFVMLPLASQSGYIPFLMMALAGFVMILNPAIGIASVLVSVPIQDAILIPFVRGELTITQVVLFGVLLGWGVTLYRYRIWLDSIVVGFLAVFAAFSISLVEMDSPGEWFGEVYRWGVAGIFYIVCRSVLTSWERIRVVLFGVVLGVLGVIAYTVYELSDWILTDQPGGWAAFRAMGTFGVPNPLAAYIEFTTLPLLVLALSGFSATIRRQLGTPFWALALISSGGGMVVLGLTQSRGGWVGMAVGIMIVFLILPARVKISTVVIGGVLASAFLLTPIGQSQVDRFSGALEENPSPVRLEHQGTLGRASLWGAGIGMAKDEPFTGVGAGEYNYHYRQYAPRWVDRFTQGQAHNGWIQMGAQAGIPGIIAFTAWLAASIHSIASAWRRATDPLGRLLAWGALAVMIAFTIHSLVDYLNVLSLGLQLSAVAAIGLALAPKPLTEFGNATPTAQRARLAPAS